MVLIRLAKVAMIGSLAAYALIVTYDNIVDYQSNYEFVRHVLSMDTTFPGNTLMHVQAPTIVSLVIARCIDHRHGGVDSLSVAGRRASVA